MAKRTFWTANVSLYAPSTVHAVVVDTDDYVRLPVAGPTPEDEVRRDMDSLFNKIRASVAPLPTQEPT